MSHSAPLFFDETAAAKSFCMTRAQFRKLVDDGHLPPPRDFGGLERWDVAELLRIGRGEAMEGGECQW
jgi:predicted DNA-binding transcriptional regulator AlpA